MLFVRNTLIHDPWSMIISLTAQRFKVALHVLTRRAERSIFRSPVKRPPIVLVIDVCIEAGPRIYTEYMCRVQYKSLPTNASLSNYPLFISEFGSSTAASTE